MIYRIILDLVAMLPVSLINHLRANDAARKLLRARHQDQGLAALATLKRRSERGFSYAEIAADRSRNIRRLERDARDNRPRIDRAPRRILPRKYPASRKRPFRLPTRCSSSPPLYFCSRTRRGIRTSPP